MDKITIRGGVPLQGEVIVSGSKNSALPILFAGLLSEQESKLTNIPNLQDIRFTLSILSALGVACDFNSEAGTLTLGAEKITSYEAPYDIVRKMRASVLALGPLLARFGEAKVSLPGGCAIGTRPINFHLTGFEQLGAKIELENGNVIARAKKLVGATIRFPFPSVGATENLMMAATLADGQTVLENSALEPEIVDLANALRSAGAIISGDGTSTIRINGVKRLAGMNHSVIGDRIEAGTYLSAALATQGRVKCIGVDPQHLTAVLGTFKKMGGEVEVGSNWIQVTGKMRPLPVELVTEPFPGFPTDMQAQVMAALCFAKGTSKITETIFENRFMHVPELMRMGAQITVQGNLAEVHGQSRLVGAPVMATDLRASASLIVAGLQAEGETVVNRIYHLDRGYERLDAKLTQLGARVVRSS